MRRHTQHNSDVCLDVSLLCVDTHMTCVSSSRHDVGREDKLLSRHDVGLGTSLRLIPHSLEYSRHDVGLGTNCCHMSEE